MFANYWIKLWIELLDDPKIGTLPDNLWRRFIELCLMAGETGQSGTLPEFNKICWKLRQKPEFLRSEMETLQNIGVLCFDGQNWRVTNFEKRQEKVSDSRRKQEQRKREKVSQLVTPEVEAEADINTSPGPMAQKVLDITKLDFGFVNRSSKHKTTFYNCLKFLTDKGITPAQVDDFDQWRRGHHWTKNGVASLSQIGEFWGQYEAWVSGGRQQGAYKNGKHYGNYESDDRGTGKELERRGVFDPNDPNDPGAIGAAALP